MSLKNIYNRETIKQKNVLYTIRKDGLSYKASTIEVLPNITHYEVVNSLKGLPVTKIDSFVIDRDNVKKFGQPMKIRVTLPDTIKVIDDFAFVLRDDWVKIKKINIPNDLDFLGECSFAGLSVNILTVPSNVKEMGISVFEDSCMTKVVLPDGITELPNYTFRGCKKLKEINFPESIVSLGSACFKSADLRYVRLPKRLKKLSDEIFVNNENLKVLELNPHLITLGFNSLVGTKKLNNLVIPKKVKDISRTFFRGCSDKLTVCFENEDWENKLDDFIFPVGVSKCFGCTYPFIPFNFEEIDNL